MTKKETGGLYLVEKPTLKRTRIGAKSARRGGLKSQDTGEAGAQKTDELAPPWIKPRNWDMSVASSEEGATLGAANDPLMEEPPGRA